MVTSTARYLSFAAMMLVATSIMASDAALNIPQVGGGGGGGSASLLATATAFGALVQSYATIVGVWYALKACMIFSYVAGGKAQPNQGMGSVLSHFIAGTLAYNSDAFFEMVHNTIPMIPDFGKLVYDAELIKSLM